MVLLTTSELYPMNGIPRFVSACQIPPSPSNRLSTTSGPPFHGSASALNADTQSPSSAPSKSNCSDFTSQAFFNTHGAATDQESLLRYTPNLTHVHSLKPCMEKSKLKLCTIDELYLAASKNERIWEILHLAFRSGQDPIGMPL